MKKVKISKRKIIITVISVCLVCVYAYQFISINSTFPQNKKVAYNTNDKVTYYQNTAIKVLNSQIIDKESILKDSGLKKEMEHYYNDNDNYKLINVEIEISNLNNEDAQVSLEHLHLESVSWSLQPFLPVVLYYNNFGVNISLKGNETKKITLSYPLSENMFSEGGWYKLEQREYYLVYSLYPEKKMVKINL